MIGPRTRCLGVLGWPVGHSFSPARQTAALAALGLDWVYGAFAVAPDQLATAIRGAAALGFAGLNLTIPHKEAALALCKEVEVMFVLGGLHSANTREMARMCRETGIPTYHLETWNDFDLQNVAGKKTAGVTAGASTPEWIIQEFVRQLEAV